MKLQKIDQAYTGPLEVLIIDIRNNRKLASEYQIQVIPTVVFSTLRERRFSVIRVS